MRATTASLLIHGDRHMSHAPYRRRLAGFMLYIPLVRPQVRDKAVLLMQRLHAAEAVVTRQPGASLRQARKQK